MKIIYNKRILLSQISSLAFFLLLFPVSAETITIGKGSGIVWEGLPFGVTMTGEMHMTRLSPNFGMASISNMNGGCLRANELKSIGGHLAFPLIGSNGADSGIGLIPRAQTNAQYTLFDESTESLTGTIGLPRTQGMTSSAVEVSDSSDTGWCLPPRMAGSSDFYSPTGPRSVSLSGNWVMVANGNQTDQQFTIAPMYAGSYSESPRGDRSEGILPGNITLRISTLECTLDTQTIINFGMVARNTVVNSELAVKTVRFVTACGQTGNHIDANINVQFRAISGLESGMPSRLALDQGGGFITGEIDSGVTGSGQCSSSSGLSFDGQPIKVGTITSQESQKAYTRNITWRLCSGGASLPTGKVSAATEILVTFN